MHTDGIPKDSWDSLQLRNPADYPKRSSLVKWQDWTYISPCITIYISSTNLKQTKEIIQIIIKKTTLGMLIFSNIWQDFNMIPKFEYYQIWLPNAN